jgi:hypothetical protein
MLCASARCAYFVKLAALSAQIAHFWKISLYEYPVNISYNECSFLTEYFSLQYPKFVFDMKIFVFGVNIFNILVFKFIFLLRFLSQMCYVTCQMPFIGIEMPLPTFHFDTFALGYPTCNSTHFREKKSFSWCLQVNIFKASKLLFFHHYEMPWKMLNSPQWNRDAIIHCFPLLQHLH